MTEDAGPRPPGRRRPGGLSRRQLLGHAGGATALLARPQALLAQAEDAGREAMARAATAFLGALSSDQRRRAAFPFGEAERLNWHYVPRSREGVPFKDMAPAPRAEAHELLRAGLSSVGYAKAVNIMQLEAVLRQIERLGLFHDPENYAVTIFGPPGPSAPWGWRLEGHHLSLNVTLVPGKPVAATPTFMGANPARVPSGPRQGFRTLAEEQDLALALARSLEPRLRGRLVIAGQSLGDIVSGPGRGEGLKAPAGVPLADLTESERALALRLVEVYARNMRSEIAEAEIRRAREAGLERLHFAWAGPVDPARPHYYRLHGPTLLIEYDNTQNDANHIHSVWRDPRNDFGADLLRAHYASGHRHA
ncbi:MAG: DUF3500 domain-containing protein [Candidatus Rokubacteria bacterium]|nr:DUF3500 domain-containing protein [Candidatus Rokubacteria bacterium]